MLVPDRDGPTMKMGAGLRLDWFAGIAQSLGAGAAAEPA
jgi:hypothetical protein